MIFAELQYDSCYSEVHALLVALLAANFSNLQSGLQGDSWVWVTEGEHKVAIDSFTAMHHQVKSAAHSALVDQVIEVLGRQYKLRIFNPPEFEVHE
jgi:hypothetical protein